MTVALQKVHAIILKSNVQPPFYPVIQRSTVQPTKRAVLCDAESPTWSEFLTVYNHILDTLSVFYGIRPKVTRKMLENACVE